MLDAFLWWSGLIFWIVWPIAFIAMLRERAQPPARRQPSLDELMLTEQVEPEPAFDKETIERVASTLRASRS